MTHESHLLATRRAELDALINAHLEADALDEGNACAFDALIDAWLHEELARIDLAEAALVREEATAAREEADEARRQAAVDSEEHHRRVQAEADAEARRVLLKTREDEARQNKALLAEAKRARRQKRLLRAEQRLEAAAARVRHAELLLLGDVPDGVPRSLHPTPSQDPSTAERAA
jgi:hypothetical protein